MDTALIAYEVSKIARKRKIELIFCGHSKGGTHASLHSFITSHRAITFNSPGVSPLTKKKVVKKLKLNSKLLNDSQTTSFVTDMDFVTNLAKLCSENRDRLISFAEHYLPTRFSPDNFGLVPPDGRLVPLTKSINPVGEVIIRFLLTSISKGSWGAGCDGTYQQLREKHSVKYVLECMNSG
jgi:hypothetical protein